MMTTPSLIDRLHRAADSWCKANDASLARLGRVVINDNGFFARIGQPGGSTTTATLERFGRYLGDGTNWPAGVVSDEARSFAAIVGLAAVDPDLCACADHGIRNNPDAEGEPTGQSDELSGGGAA